MKLRRILLPFLMFSLIGSSTFQYSYAKKSKVEQKIDVIVGFMKSMAGRIKQMVEEADYDTSDGISFVFPVKLGKKEIEMGFEWKFDSDPEKAVGAGDISEGFDFIRGDLVSPTLKDLGLPVPGKFGRIRLLNVVLGLEEPPGIVKRVVDPITKAMGPFVGVLQRMLFVRGDTHFLIKTVLLFNSYRKLGRIEDIPTELYQLFARLSRTIDWKLTAEAAGEKYDPMKRYRRKDYKKVVYFRGPSSFIDRAPKLVRDILYDINMDVNEENFQEWQDRKDGPTKFMYARSEARQKKNLSDRVALAKAKIPPLIGPGLNFSDRRLFVYFCERLTDEVLEDGSEELRTSMQEFLEETVPKFKKLAVGDAPYQKDIHEKNLKKLDETVAKLAGIAPVTEEPSVDLDLPGEDVHDDVGVALGQLEGITDVRSRVGYVVKMADWATADRDFTAEQEDQFSNILNSLAGRLGGEVEVKPEKAVWARKVAEALKRMQDKIPFSQKFKNRLDGEIIKKFKELYVTQVPAAKGPEFPPPVQKWRRPIPVPLYLDFLYWKATSMIFMPFYGDPGYLYDDSILPYMKAGQQLIAIMLRAAMDVKSGVVKTRSRRRHPEDEFTPLDKDGDPFEDSDGNEIKLGRAVWDRIVGTKIKYKRDPKTRKLLRPKQIEKEGTGAQGAFDDAKLDYQYAAKVYKIARKKKGSKHRTTQEAEKKMKQAKKEYTKASKALSKARRKYEKLVFSYYRFDRAPYLRAKTIIKMCREKLLELNPERTDLPEDIEYKEIVKKVVKEDRAFFMEEIRPLREERVKMFVMREVVILIFTRTKHGKKILFDPGVGQFLAMVDLKPDELLQFAGGDPDEVLSKQDEWLDEKSFEEEEEEEAPEEESGDEFGGEEEE